jgi:hypothetical protein
MKNSNPRKEVRGQNEIQMVLFLFFKRPLQFEEQKDANKILKRDMKVSLKIYLEKTVP